MNINFLGPVLPTDSFTQMAFVEILNIILTSDNIVDVNRMLIGRNVNPTFGSLSGHFRWSYATTISRCGSAWSTIHQSASDSAYSASISVCWQAATGKGTI